MSTFVMVGHCGPDSYLLKGAVARAVPDATIVFADDAATLKRHIHADSVLLVNRVLDAGFRTESGIELIEGLAKSEAAPRMLLISNYADAQEQALAVGAMPGFGKRDVNTSRAASALRLAADAASKPQSAP